MKREESIETLIQGMKLNQKEVLNFEEAVAFTGISKSTLYKLTASLGIPFYKPTPNRVFFKRTELEEWLLRNKCQTKSDIQNQIALECIERSYNHGG